jgi:hypothetical protein
VNADCHGGDHQWNGTGVCSGCGKRLRCYCGAFVREDRISEHLKKCRLTEAARQEEYEALNNYLLGEAMV